MHFVDLPFDILVCILSELNTAATWQIRGLRNLVRSVKNSKEEDLVDIVAKFGPLCSVGIECTTNNASPDSWVWRASVMHTSLRASLHTLHTLIFCVSLEFISVFLPPPTLVFPNIRTLVIKLFTIPVTAAIGGHPSMNPLVLSAFETHIKPFIARHSRSLCSLDLTSPKRELSKILMRHSLRIDNYTVDIALVLRAIPPIDHLAAISFIVLNTIPANELPHIAKFLGAHAGTLRTLNISFSGTYWSPAEIACTTRLLASIRLPQLEELSIDCGRYSCAPDAVLETAILECIRCHPALKSLSLLGVTQSPAGVDQLLDPVAGCFRQGVHLHRLRLNLEELTPSVLRMFANNLPNLHELELRTLRWRRRTGCIGVHRDRVYGEEYEFAVAVSRHRYPNWRLRHLFLTYGSGITKYCAVAVMTALPALHTLNGLGRTQFLEEAQENITGYQAECLPWDLQRSVT
ncbi:hypothetical protein HYPSUDRAFT_63837 [Hypholoma sublateritium FD-334 SS-4]|uniref:F-box domain-containing protein n=1 Tax=Hypholoma sublateritium (strain FD-334 SS-4) TaxID=945553 RepID=A0A0D2P6M6_HYPSF|nr:hypothetical protein HYPSUDRAFT_63837 [Hypholoma sublateritium FD-334 SS-4]